MSHPNARFNKMNRLLLATAGVLVCAPAFADQFVSPLGGPSYGSVIERRQGTSGSVNVPVDELNPLPVTTAAGPSTNGNGSLSATTASARINTMTVNSSSGALPAGLSGMTVINTGNTDAAFCSNPGSAGATCTCPTNGVAATNGITLPAGKGGYIFNLGGVSSANPTVVACSGTAIIQFQW